MKASDDKMSAKLSIAGTYSSSQLETLITELLILRANLLPEVPLEPPKKSDDPALHTSNISVQDNPHWQARPLRDGRIRMYLRHAGLGWMVFNLPVDQACTFRDFLIVNTPKANPRGIDLFVQDVDDSGLPH